MKKTIITTAALFFMALSFNSCNKKDTPLNDPTTNPIKIFTGQMQCLWDESKQANPKAFLDLDNGKVYDVTTAPGHAKEIDLIWMDGSGGALLCSPNDFYEPSSITSPNFQEGPLFANWTQRNQTVIDNSSSQTVAQFNAVTNEPELAALYGTLFDNSSIEFAFMECTSAHFANIYFVETTTNGVKKRGYIRFTQGQRGNNNFANFEIKIQS
jgi:hypothetical protein